MVQNLLITLITTIITVFYYSIGFAAERLPVFVSIVPQKFFVQQIGGDLVDVRVMVQPGASPHIYEPKPRQMAALSKTRLYFSIGVSFEKVWLRKFAAANPEMKVVHTDHGIDKIHMAAHRHDDDGHAQNDSEHSHREDEHIKQHAGDEGHAGHEDTESAGRDPHIWLAPSLVKIQARTIRDALQASDPAHRADYAANYEQFATEIDRLDSDLREIFAGKRDLRFMVFHPSWGYFAKAYNLKQVPIEIEGKNPKPAQLKDLIENAREKKIRMVFVQPQFSTRSAKLIAREIGGQVAFADPLAEDWMDNLRRVAKKFKRALN